MRTLATLAITLILSLNALDQAHAEENTSLTGRWAQLVVTTSISKLPVAGEVASVTKSFAIIDVKQDEQGRIITQEQVCDLQISSDSDSVKTIIPQKFLTAVSGQSRTGYTTKQKDSLRLVLPRKVTTFGANVKSGDALPTDEDDKRVIDADKDGKPGLTVRVKGLIDGELYVVTRGSNELYGALKPSGRVEGFVRWTSEQNVIDATSVFLKIEPTTKPDKRPEKNYFRWHRIPAQTSCKEVLSRAKEWLH